MKKRLAHLVLFALAAASVPLAGAEERRGTSLEELGSLPIEITAVRLVADSARNTVTFDGNVLARQGDVTLLTDRLTAEYTRETGVVDKIVAEGNVRVVQEGKEARSVRAVFYNMEQRIVLSGNAELVQGPNSLKGETVTMFLRENRSVATGGEGGRVTAVIHPKGSPEKGKDKGKANP